MGHFGMALEENESSLSEFGRYAGGKDRRKKTWYIYIFRVYTHCSHGRSSKFRVKEKNSKKKSEKKCKEVRWLIRDMGTIPVKAIIKKLNGIFVGYYHYYGITDNHQSLCSFWHRVMRSLFKWLNRRDQKKSYNWEGFNDMLKAYPLAMLRIYVNVYIR